MATSMRQAYEFGPFRLDPAERALVRGGQPVALTPKVFDTLVLLVENAGRLITKDEFMKQVWADAFVEDGTLAQSISQLRKALGDLDVIETVPKQGYRFLGSVRPVPSPAGPSPTGAAPTAGMQGSAPSGTRAYEEVIRRRQSAYQRWLPVWAALLVIAAAIPFYVHRRNLSARTNMRSLAVLPLQNLSGDSSQEYFVDGMTDELITDLAQIHSLRVISRTSVMQFKNTQKSLPEIAAQLNVDAVVEGSVLRTGNSIRITAQLLDARRDQHLWAASYEREITNVLQMQGQVAKSIAEQINIKLTPEEGAKLSVRPPMNPAAYDALLTGKYLFNRRNAADTEKAIGYLRRSLELDSNSAEAWATLGSCYTSLGSDLAAADPAKVISQARAAITKALQLDPDLAQAHTTLAWIKLWYEWDWSGAEQEFRRSIELNPNDSAAHREYSHYLQLRKRSNEAIVENKLAIQLAPLDILLSIHLAWLYVDARDSANAVAQSQHVLEMDPHFTGAYLLLARGYELQSKWEDAIAAIEKAKAAYPQGYLASIAYIRAASGDKLRAQKALSDLTEFSRHNYVSPVRFATCYAALGDLDRAFKYLDSGYRQHDTWMIALEVDFGLDNLRTDPRFHELERRVGF